jgi:hypothetical protein
MGDYTHYWIGIEGLGENSGGRRNIGQLTLFAGKMSELLFEAFREIRVIGKSDLIRYFSNCAGILLQ